jgi:pyruvate dehydrogenase E2 component (dihydrolipoamide acetyltransferase)
VSPYARARASALGVDLATVAPGADGVVHAAEVERAVEGADRGAERPADPQAAMRRAIAAAMSLSKRDIPHYYLAHTIDLGPAMTWLARENETRAVPDRLLSGVLLLAAAARAARDVPEINARWAVERAVPNDR